MRAFPHSHSHSLHAAVAREVMVAVCLLLGRVVNMLTSLQFQRDGESLLRLTPSLSLAREVVLCAVFFQRQTIGVPAANCECFSTSDRQPLVFFVNTLLLEYSRNLSFLCLTECHRFPTAMSLFHFPFAYLRALQAFLLPNSSLDGCAYSADSACLLPLS